MLKILHIEEFSKINNADVAADVAADGFEDFHCLNIFISFYKIQKLDGLKK